jgi:hypothetical protein
MFWKLHGMVFMETGQRDNKKTQSLAKIRLAHTIGQWYHSRVDQVVC